MTCRHAPPGQLPLPDLPRLRPHAPAASSWYAAVRFTGSHVAVLRVVYDPAFRNHPLAETPLRSGGWEGGSGHGSNRGECGTHRSAIARWPAEVNLRLRWLRDTSFPLGGLTAIRRGWLGVGVRVLFFPLWFSPLHGAACRQGGSRCPPKIPPTARPAAPRYFMKGREPTTKTKNI